MRLKRKKPVMERKNRRRLSVELETADTIVMLSREIPAVYMVESFPCLRTCTPVPRAVEAITNTRVATPRPEHIAHLQG
jgi:hypothetical protein